MPRLRPALEGVKQPGTFRKGEKHGGGMGEVYHDEGDANINKDSSCKRHLLGF